MAGNLCSIRYAVERPTIPPPITAIFFVMALGSGKGRGRGCVSPQGHTVHTASPHQSHVEGPHTSVYRGTMLCRSFGAYSRLAASPTCREAILHFLLLQSTLQTAMPGGESVCPQRRPKSSKNQALSSLLSPGPKRPFAATEIQESSGRKNFSPAPRRRHTFDRVVACQGAEHTGSTAHAPSQRILQ